MARLIVAVPPELANGIRPQRAQWQNAGLARLHATADNLLHYGDSG
ncbi:MAG TPA: hypothetical protein VNL70_05500 [Tepidisphaeraceae bacterium]|nr:hypothetical protein [Tepidisphaeraceae bacterium]